MTPAVAKCPWCKSDDSQVVLPVPCQVECRKCGASGPYKMAEAVAAWNAVAEAMAEAGRLREALAFYASEASWESTPLYEDDDETLSDIEIPGEVFRDKGERARSALAPRAGGAP